MDVEFVLYSCFRELEKIAGLPSIVRRGGGGAMGDLMRARHAAGQEASRLISSAGGIKNVTEPIGRRGAPMVTDPAVRASMGEGARAGRGLKERSFRTAGEADAASGGFQSLPGAKPQSPVQRSWLGQKLHDAKMSLQHRRAKTIAHNRFIRSPEGQEFLRSRVNNSAAASYGPRAQMIPDFRGGGMSLRGINPLPDG
jgi:hypothetical protein